MSLLRTLDVPEVLRLTGISYRQLDYWVRNGWLRPQAHGGGSGVPRDWPARELRIARIMGRFTRAGIEPAKAAMAARQIVEDGRAEVDLGEGVHVRVAV